MGCVIFYKNTLSKNRHPQVGGSGLLLHSVLGGHGQESAARAVLTVSMFPGRSWRGAMAEGPIRQGGAPK